MEIQVDMIISEGKEDEGGLKKTGGNLRTVHM